MATLDIISQLRIVNCGINNNATYQKFVEQPKQESITFDIPETTKQEILKENQSEDLIPPKEVSPNINIPQTVDVKEPRIVSDVSPSSSRIVKEFVSNKDNVNTIVNNGGNGVFVFPPQSSRYEPQPHKSYTTVIKSVDTFYPDFESSTNKRIKFLRDLSKNMDMIDSRRSDTSTGNFDAATISSIASRLGIVGSGSLTKAQNVAEIRKMISEHLTNSSSINA